MGRFPFDEPKSHRWRNASAGCQFPDVHVRPTTNRRQGKVPVGRDGHIKSFVGMHHGRAGELTGSPVPVANLPILVAGKKILSVGTETNGEQAPRITRM